MSQAVLPRSKVATGASFVADTLSRSILLIGCLMVLQRGIGFLRSFYVCGMLSPAEVGRWDLAFSFLTLAAPLAVLGIPGSFGRYVAHYRLRDQQDRFFKQTFIVCFTLVLIASCLIYSVRTDIARFLLGQESDGEIVALLAIGLPIIVFFNFATSWFIAQQLNRIVFRIQLTQTLFFATLCILMLQVSTVSATSVIGAYILSCLFGFLLACGYHLATRQQALVSPKTASATEFEPAPVWRKILPFAIWVWVSNALINLFAVCDRLLLVNFHSAGGTDIQSLVGQYHTSRVFPLLLLAVGAMLGSMITPYLSKDWESGKRDSVVNRLNVMLKVIGLSCVCFATVVLLIAPLLYSGMWQDKFAIGESLLPLTLSYCSLAAMTLVAQKFFWCIEKTWYSSCVLMIGVVVNFVLGLSLIDAFGIQGVVTATLISHAIVLIGVLILCKRNSMAIDRGVIILVVSLLAICFGKLFALISCVATLAVALYSQLIFSDADKQFAYAKLRTIHSRITGAYQ